MLDLIEDADVVVGSRLAEGASLGRRQPLRRRIAGRSFQQLCRLALREPTSDLFCGFKLWRADAAEDAYARTRLDGWTFDAEVLAMARALGYRLRETGIVWTDRDGSRVRMARVLLPVVRELLAARRHVRREARDQPRGAYTTTVSGNQPDQVCDSTPAVAPAHRLRHRAAARRRSRDARRGSDRCRRPRAPRAAPVPDSRA